MTLKKQLPKPHSRERNSTASVWLAEYEPKQGEDSKESGLERELEKHVLKISSEFAFPDDGASIETAAKRERLQVRERLLYTKLSHENIPQFKGVNQITIDGVSFNYLATQYIESPTLLERIHAEQPLNEQEARIVLKDILAALTHIHCQSRPIFHRDIRPSNILFNGSKAYLFDFNFTKVYEEYFSNTK